MHFITLFPVASLCFLAFKIELYATKMMFAKGKNIRAECNSVYFVKQHWICDIGT
jgi:hypothetical protein